MHWAIRASRLVPGATGEILPLVIFPLNNTNICNFNVSNLLFTHWGNNSLIIFIHKTYKTIIVTIKREKKCQYSCFTGRGKHTT